MINLIKRFYSKYLIRLHRIQDWQNSLDKISHKKKFTKNKKKLKVLVGPSFSLWEHSSAFDRLLSTALEIRGCEIIPMYCNSIQKVECNCVGGDWVNNEFKINCKKCKFYSQRMWKPYKRSLIKLSSFVEENKLRKSLDKSLNNLNLKSLISYNKNKINYGALAKDILVNNHLVSSISLVPNATHLLREHIKNLIILNASYLNIIKKLKPDRVITNDSSYGMWKLIEIICKEKSIPFYSHWPITKNRVVIAHNDAALNFNFKSSWKNFLKKKINKKDLNTINTWLAGKRGTYASDKTNLEINSKFDNIIQNIDIKKPTLLLAANVCWDVAALNKQIIFSDMNEWIIETIKWFKLNSNYQLIIKPHPWENMKGLPLTNETVETSILSKIKKIPDNVFLLKNNTHISTNEIKNNFDIRGVTVHTTTVGLEYPASGIFSITTAKAPFRNCGFTYDPKTKDEYFEKIYQLLSKNRFLSDKKILLAKKFIKFYNFHYSTNLNLYDGSSVKLLKGFENAINKKKGTLDYICKKIINGKSINDENSWLPFT